MKTTIFMSLCLLFLCSAWRLSANTPINYGYLPNEIESNSSNVFTPSSAKFLISSKGRKLGVKVTQLDKTRYAITVRDMRGKKLIATTVKRDTRSRKSTQSRFKLIRGDGSSFFVTAALNKKQWIQLMPKPRNTTIGVIEYQDGDDYQEGPSSEGFFGNLFRDIAAVVVTAIGWLNGNNISIQLSNGKFIGTKTSNGQSTIEVGNNEITSFRLEPGLEEDPTVWY